MEKLMLPILRFPVFQNEWERKRFDSYCVKISSGKSNVLDKGKYPVHGSTGLLGYTNEYSHDGSNILVARVGANAGLLNCVEGKVGVTDNTLVIELIEPELQNFYYYLLESINLNKFIFGSGQPLITGGLLKALIVHLPSNKNEKENIANFFFDIDKKISLLEKKHELLNFYKKGVMQKLLSQEIRFKDEAANDFPEWEERNFNEFISIRSEFPASCDDAPLSSLTIANGIEAKSARYVRDFLVTDNKGAYKLVYPEDFVANPMNLRFGAIAKNHGSLIVKISKYYDVFYCDNSIDNDFFELFLLSYEMRKQYHQTATGTLEEKKRVHFSEFIRFKKKLPSKAEQIKISSFDKTLKTKISLLQKQIQQTKAFKKWLLQNMFV
jgi:type I restriction enzyme S subunit